MCSIFINSVLYVVLGGRKYTKFNQDSEWLVQLKLQSTDKRKWGEDQWHGMIFYVQGLENSVKLKFPKWLTYSISCISKQKTPFTYIFKNSQVSTNLEKMLGKQNDLKQKGKTLGKNSTWSQYIPQCCRSHSSFDMKTVTGWWGTETTGINPHIHNQLTSHKVANDMSEMGLSLNKWWWENWTPSVKEWTEGLNSVSSYANIPESK